MRAKVNNDDHGDRCDGDDSADVDGDDDGDNSRATGSTAVGLSIRSTQPSNVETVKVCVSV